MTGKGGPFQQINKKLDSLSKDHKEILDELDELQAQLAVIKTQLDRIEDAVSGTQAAHLIVSVGTPEEQP